MKIMFLNLQYGIGLNGSWSNLLRYFYRYFYCPKKVEKRVLGDLKNILIKEKPDLLCLAETHLSHVQNLIDESYVFYDVENKYGLKSFLRKLPGFRKNSNGFLDKKATDFKRHFLRHGTKKLIYEIKLGDDFGLFMGHFSLSKVVRQKQFAELIVLVKKYKKVIICGDFNIFSGYKELKLLLGDSGLKIVGVQEQKTYPSCKPRLHLDIFLCSEDIKIKDARVLHNQLSDHLPVILEI